MKQRGRLTIPLLDYLAGCMGCTYLSDLRFLRRWERGRLFREIEKLSPAAAPLEEWNDALYYLTGGTPEQTAEGARNALMTFLTQQKKPQI